MAASSIPETPNCPSCPNVLLCSNEMVLTWCKRCGRITWGRLNSAGYAGWDSEKLKQVVEKGFCLGGCVAGALSSPDTYYSYCPTDSGNKQTFDTEFRRLLTRTEYVSTLDVSTFRLRDTGQLLIGVYCDTCRSGLFRESVSICMSLPGKEISS